MLSRSGDTPNDPWHSERTYELILQNLRDYAVFTLDLDRRISWWNVGAQRLFGYDPDEVVGQPASVIFTREDNEAGKSRDELNYALKAGWADDERWHVRRDGSRFWAQGVVNTIQDEQGKVLGYVKIVRDLTERKRAEDRIKSLNEALEKRVEERTREVRTMALNLNRAEHRERTRIAEALHDHLAQLLVSCRMKLSMVTPADEQAGQMIGEIDEVLGESMDYVRTLIADLRPTVLYEQGLEAGLEWLADWMGKRFDLKVSVESDAVDKPVDEEMGVVMFQSVRELLMNVVKHSQATEAKVVVRRTGERIRVAVEDKGVGFNTTEQADDASAGAEAGDAGPVASQGYGLFSVRERVRLIGGEVLVDSSPGEGTRVCLFAPLADERDSGAEAAAA